MDGQTRRMLQCGVVGILIAAGVLLDATPTDAFQRRRRRAPGITMVVDRDNLPYGSEDEETPGINVEIARLLGKELDRTVYYRWINSLYESPLEQVIEKHGDCAVGVPLDTMQVEDDIGRVGNKVLFSDPYYGTGYVAVAKPGFSMPASIRNVRDRKIGSERGAMVSYRLREWGITPDTFLNQMAILLGLRQGKVDVGALWADAGWLLKENPILGLEIVPGYTPEPGLRINIAAAVRKDDTALLEQINQALRRIVDSGAVREIVTKYGVPYYPPFREE